MTTTATSMQILMIDDAVANLEVYKRLLGRIPDVECIAYESSAEALKWASVHDPDLVLVDYDMPAPNGLQFIEGFRKLRAKGMTPIVMIASTNGFFSGATAASSAAF